MVSGRRLFWTAALGSLLLAGGFLGAGREMAAYADPPPNVVVFLTDDMGWTDWQYDAARNPTGSVVYETPNLLQLAQQSVVFNNAYAACPVCSPTRSSILTGRSPARTTLTNFLPGNPNTSATLREPSNWLRNLAGSEITLAESMKAAGYSTGFVGKWHLGSNAGFSGIDPLQNGFDVNIGGNGSGGPESSGGWFAGADGMWSGLPGLSTPGQYPADKYLSDALDEHVGTFIAQNASTNTPFFLADWDYLVHIPLDAPANLVTKYQTKINTLQGQGVNLKGHTNATYAAMMEKLDDSVGAMLHRLDDPNNDGNTSDSIRNNTIVVFSSDNGGVYDAEGNPTRNLPLREGKGSMYEGGIRVPEMISWTGNPNFAAGTVTNQRTSSYDLYPTLLDLTGLLNNPSVPKNSTIDGVNIRAALEGATFDRGLLYWHYPHRSNQDLASSQINGGSFVSAVADKDWKLLFYYEDRHYELYSLTADIGETTNLLAYNPAIAHDLSLAMQLYLVSVNAQMPVKIATGLPEAVPQVLAAPTPGDYNGDSVVNLTDYAQWRADFGSTTHLTADGNRNGIVDAGDFVFWRNLFAGSGGGAAFGGSAGVPEPGSALLLVMSMIAGVAFPIRRRRRASV